MNPARPMSMTFQSKPQEPAEAGQGIFDPKDLNRLLDALRAPACIRFQGISRHLESFLALDSAKMEAFRWLLHGFCMVFAWRAEVWTS